jgi:hypothetical protein
MNLKSATFVKIFLYHAGEKEDEEVNIISGNTDLD